MEVHDKVQAVLFLGSGDANDLTPPYLTLDLRLILNVVEVLICEENIASLKHASLVVYLINHA